MNFEIDFMLQNVLFEMSLSINIFNFISRQSLIINQKLNSKLLFLKTRSRYSTLKVAGNRMSRHPNENANRK
jgi:hypothetical protein